MPSVRPERREQVALALAGRAGERLADALGLPASRDGLLRRTDGAASVAALVRDPPRQVPRRRLWRIVSFPAILAGARLRGEPAKVADAGLFLASRRSGAGGRRLAARRGQVAATPARAAAVLAAAGQGQAEREQQRDHEQQHAACRSHGHLLRRGNPAGARPIPAAG
jgi:hypothetical protein